MGFDKVEETTLNLKPMIANMRTQLEKHPGPIISGKPVGMKASNMKPPLATGPSFMPGHKQSTLITAVDAQKHEVRSHSIGVSQEGKRIGSQNLP